MGEVCCGGWMSGGVGVGGCMGECGGVGVSMEVGVCVCV